MLRSRFFWFVVGLLVGPLILAADSQYGSQGRDLVSQLRNSGAVFFDAAGGASQEASGFVSE